MKTGLLIAALAAPALTVPARAEDPKPAATDSIMTFFRHLRESLSQSAVQAERKKSGRRSGSVAAVRGASQASSLGDPNETTLKGDVRSRKDKLVMAEDAEFAKGVDLILAGKTGEGVKALEDFKTAHPKSRELAKVQDAIDRAKGLPAAKPAEAAAAPEPVKPDAAK
ncbi:MAG: hypothetical protein KGJ84_02685 [Elusimicrobia bacterium]|nr:hypothetical protein [Elusimicrobiota bacterium]